jgi:hypothetical protein
MTKNIGMQKKKKTYVNKKVRQYVIEGPSFCFFWEGEDAGILFVPIVFSSSSY